MEPLQIRVGRPIGRRQASSLLCSLLLSRGAMMRWWRSVTGSKPPSEGEATPRSQPQKVNLTIVPYGVLGTRMAQNGGMVNKAPPPSADLCAFVDPAGLSYIQRFGPAGAGGAAGAIYRFLGISNDPAFPPSSKPSRSSP